MAAFTEYSSFLILNALGLHVASSHMLSFTFGLVASFLLNRRWVFKSTRDIHRQFYKFIILALLNLIASNGLILLFVYNFSFNPMLAKVVCMGMVAAWNYLIFSKLIFSTRSQSKEGET